MNTKPSAQKFRIRRPGDAPAAGPSAAAAAVPPTPGGPARPAPDFEPGPRRDDGFGAEPFATAAAQAPQGAGAARAPAPQGPEATVDGPRPEEMTGRQLRIARRLAHRHGLSPSSDAEAVQMLRARGIDPLERKNLLALVAPEQVEARAPGLPQTSARPADPGSRPARAAWRRRRRATRFWKWRRSSATSCGGAAGGCGCCSSGSRPSSFCRPRWPGGTSSAWRRRCMPRSPSS